MLKMSKSLPLANHDVAAFAPDFDLFLDHIGMIMIQPIADYGLNTLDDSLHSAARLTAFKLKVCHE